MRALVLSIAVVGGGCDCAYGGPGCGEPGLAGVCGGAVPLGASIATVVYGDDTGAHPTTVQQAEAVPGDRLTVTAVVRDDGDQAFTELALVGRAEGEAELRVRGVAGWGDTMFFYPVTVAPTLATPCDAEDIASPADHAP